MAIGNVTPDSFYAASRLQEESRVVAWAQEAVRQGADILDIGACSTRPGSTPVEEAEEWRRLAPALKAIREMLPDVRLSVDTFRPSVMERALNEFGPMMINDISGGCEAMYALARNYRVPYIWTLRGNLELPAQHPELQDLDLILDPGFGFIGSVEADYRCMRQMENLQQYHRPVLVGVSRKSMLWKPLGLRPDDCLSATQVLHFYALQHGATILRVHDVAEAVQTIQLYERLTINH